MKLFMKLAQGMEILTHELCKQANSVISFELDNLLFSNARNSLLLVIKLKFSECGSF